MRHLSAVMALAIACLLASQALADPSRADPPRADPPRADPPAAATSTAAAPPAVATSTAAVPTAAATPAKPARRAVVAAQTQASAPPATVTLCAALEAAARRNGLPYDFFSRLIWQESRFDPTARSPAGAEGVAQFMPGTAAERGLSDPFEPARALDESAAYLKELRQRFGNLGLAAAAYNAGPGRLGRWIAGTAALPQETIDYVSIVTGRSVLEWRSADPPSLAPEAGFSCVAFAGRAGRIPLPASVTGGEPGLPPPKAWAVILVGSFNKAAVTAEFALVRAKYAEALGPLAPLVRRRHLGGAPAKKYVVQVEEDDRAAGNRLCNRLLSSGGNCVVLRNILR